MIWRKVSDKAIKKRKMKRSKKNKSRIRKRKKLNKLNRKNNLSWQINIGKSIMNKMLMNFLKIMNEHIKINLHQANQEYQIEDFSSMKNSEKTK